MKIRHISTKNQAQKTRIQNDTKKVNMGGTEDLKFEVITTISRIILKFNCNINFQCKLQPTRQPPTMNQDATPLDLMSIEWLFQTRNPFAKRLRLDNGSRRVLMTHVEFCPTRNLECALGFACVPTRRCLKKLLSWTPNFEWFLLEKYIVTVSQRVCFVCLRARA